MLSHRPTIPSTALSSLWTFHAPTGRVFFSSARPSRVFHDYSRVVTIRAITEENINLFVTFNCFAVDMENDREQLYIRITARSCKRYYFSLLFQNVVCRCSRLTRHPRYLSINITILTNRVHVLYLHSATYLYVVYAANGPNKDLLTIQCCCSLLTIKKRQWNSSVAFNYCFLHCSIRLVSQFFSKTMFRYHWILLAYIIAHFLFLNYFFPPKNRLYIRI